MAGHDKKAQEPQPEEQSLLGTAIDDQQPRKPCLAAKWRVTSIVSLMTIAVFLLTYLAVGYGSPGCRSMEFKSMSDIGANLSSRVGKHHHRRAESCDGVDGYECFTDISHRWGQYSPYFSVEEDSVSNSVPDRCEVTFVQVLSRHGARYPTASKSSKYAELIKTIQANATAYHGKTAFLKSYNYTMGSDDLTSFGERQMVNSGIKFYERYAALARDHIPFVRSSGSSRVIESGKYFIQGLQQTKAKDARAESNQASATINVVISEDAGSNNTLNHNTCPAFEASELGDDIEDAYTKQITPAIAVRLEKNLPGVSLTDDQVIYLMDMCPFDTISTTEDGSILSPFCNLFTSSEWSQYNYLQSLGKYYGYGAGNPLGPSQGVGFVNELIARMTHTPVHDSTTTNRTLDAPGAASFPVNKAIYADFTHDNGMIPIFFALGLYNGTAPLSTEHVQSAAGSGGYSAAWAVPLGARAYFEMMSCRGEAEPLVRAIVNDRVVPLHGCAADGLGRCRRSDFVKALSFARAGGDWNACYA
jgi:3-phytase